MATRVKPVRSKKSKASPYWWFQGESVREITRRLNENPDGRLVVRLQGKEMTLDVESVGISIESHNPVNESHVCPPDCG